MAPKKVVVVGLGRIGLPSAACFAHAGFDVLGVDVNEARLKGIRAGEVHPLEPGLK
jgi:UDP-N-acetyl-D-mannosaminuronic acid dehydrogenase